MPMPRGSDPKNWLEYQSALLCHRDFWTCYSILLTTASGGGVFLSFCSYGS